MPMMIDVQCSKCSKRFGWSGSFATRPPCPRCAHRPPQAELDAIDARMAADDERRRTDPMAATAETLRRQRVDAGLTLRQAAAVMGMAPSDLSDVENGRSPLAEETAAKMRTAYGVGP
jgi:ribosome-binding protein aMBF1 (putative translation factor)